MFEIDHLMVEAEDPLMVANAVSERLGLPLAWPLIEKEDYTSIGVNFGSINIEFINFRVRFGSRETTFSGLSGFAFRTVSSLNESLEKLKAAQLSYRTGEDCQSHTTYPIEESRFFPTIFLVKYHFDTSGWFQRLKNEFAGCGGGKYRIKGLKLLSIAGEIPLSVENLFQIHPGNKNRIHFESEGDQNVVISDLIENLEIVIR